MWLSQRDDQRIANIGFTGATDAHREQLESLSAMPFCVVEMERSFADLERIADDAFRFVEHDLGLHFTSSSYDEPNNRVRLAVWVATAEHQAALDLRYGGGAVTIRGKLRPVNATSLLLARTYSGSGEGNRTGVQGVCANDCSGVLDGRPRKNLLVAGFGGSLRTSLSLRPRELARDGIAPPQTSGRRYARGMAFDRISVDHEIMGGVPCIRGTRIPVTSVVSMVAEGMTIAEIIGAFPQLAEEDIQAALRYAAAAVDERELPLRPAG